MVKWLRVGVSFGRWGLAADDNWVRHRVLIKGWIWTPFFTYRPRTKGGQCDLLEPTAKMEFTRSEQ